MKPEKINLPMFMEKINTLIALPLLVFVVQLPAFAVDYLQCREMLRTKNEMIAIAKAEDNDFMEAFVYPKCPEYDKNGEIYSSYFYKIYDCINKQKSVQTGVGHFFSPEGIRVARAAAKVVSDMKKSKCPY